MVSFPSAAVHAGILQQSGVDVTAALKSLTETPVYDIPSDILIKHCKDVKGPYPLNNSPDAVADVFFCKPPLSAGNMGGVFLGVLLCKDAECEKKFRTSDIRVAPTNRYQRYILFQLYGNSMPPEILEYTSARGVVVKFNTRATTKSKSWKSTSIKHEMEMTKKVTHPLFASLLGEIDLRFPDQLGFYDNPISYKRPFSLVKSVYYRRLYVGPGAVLEYIDGPTLHKYLGEYLKKSNAARGSVEAATTAWDNQLSCFIAQITLAQNVGLSQGVMNQDMHFKNILVLPPTPGSGLSGTPLKFSFTDAISCPRLKFIDLGLAHDRDKEGLPTFLLAIKASLQVAGNTFRPMRDYHPHLKEFIMALSEYTIPNKENWDGPIAEYAIDWEYIANIYMDHFKKNIKPLLQTRAVPYWGQVSHEQIQRLFGTK